jgi:hypothetical protein
MNTTKTRSLLLASALTGALAGTAMAAPATTIPMDDGKAAEAPKKPEADKKPAADKKADKAAPTDKAADKGKEKSACGGKDGCGAKK